MTASLPSSWGAGSHTQRWCMPVVPGERCLLVIHWPWQGLMDLEAHCLASQLSGSTFLWPPVLGPQMQEAVASPVHCCWGPELRPACFSPESWFPRPSVRVPEARASSLRPSRRVFGNGIPLFFPGYSLLSSCELFSVACTVSGCFCSLLCL